MWGLALSLVWGALALPARAEAGSAAEPAPEGDVAGHWKGSIQLPTQQLGFDVDLRRDDEAWSGDITIPAQGARDLPLQGVAVEGRAVAFSIAGIPGDPTFRGEMAEDGATIAGTFSQGGGETTFSLSRAASDAAEARGELGEFRAFLESARESWEVPGLAVAVVVDGEVVLAEGYGLRDVDEELPVTADTLFAIGSTTKAFTTFALATLVDEGELDWDRPVVDYLPGFRLLDPVTTRLITPRDLVTHRSGMPRHDRVWYGNRDLSREQLVERMAHLPLNATLRQKYQYNNLMYLAAGYLLEQLSGQTWEEAVSRRIFEPLGFSHAVFGVEDLPDDVDLARPYEKRDGELVEVPFRPVGNMGPAGSIEASVGELARWVQLHLSGGSWEGTRLLSPAALEELHRPQMVTGELPELAEVGPASYAMGWRVDTYRGHRRVGHAGQIDGFSAVVGFFPDDGVGVVALANEGHTPLPLLVALHASDRFLGLEPIDWNTQGLQAAAAGEQAGDEAKANRGAVRRPGTRPAHALEEYAGTYRHPGYGDLTVELDGEPEAGRLRFVYNGIVTPLEHWHFEVFSGAEGAEDPAFEGQKLLFETGLDGRVAALATPFEPAVDPIVFERLPDARLSGAAYLAGCVGRYVLGPQVVEVALEGGALTLSFPGQPLFHLAPVVGGAFKLREALAAQVRFLEEEGRVTGIQIDEAGRGVYVAERLSGGDAAPGEE